MIKINNRKILIEHINEAVLNYQEQTSNPLSFKHFVDVIPVENSILKNVCVKLENYLEVDSSFSKLNNLMIRTENGSSSIRPSFFARKLVERAILEDGADSAVKWLENIYSENKASGFSVMALWGVSVTHPILMENGISLIPIESIPDSAHKRWLVGKNWLQSQIEALPGPLMNAPTSALIIRTVIDPLLVEVDSSNNEAFKNRELLCDARLALTMLGPCVPVEACYWFSFEDQDLASALISDGRLHSHFEIVPQKMFIPFAFNADLPFGLIGKYLKMKGGEKRLLTIALGRLNQGLRRINPGDQAMEICIALEALLADGGTENTYKIGLRAALLLGDEPKTKQETRAIIVAAYEMRSSLVHNGFVNSEIKVRNRGKWPADVVAKRAANICSDVIQHIVKLGHIPNWFDFELNAM